MRQRLAIGFFAALAAIFVVSVAVAQSPGLGIKKDTTLTGTGSSGSPLGVNTANIQRRVTGTCASPNAVAAVAADGTVTCTSGVGTASGTANTVAKFTGASALGNSSVKDDSTSVYTVGNEFHLNGADASTATGWINFYSNGSTTTQFRTLRIGDGKGAGIATFTGTDQSVSFVGNATLGDSAAADTHTINGRTTLSDTASAATATRTALTIANSGTYDTTGSGLVSGGISISSTSTRSAGANTLQNRALLLAASGGQQNTALQVSDGDVTLNTTSGSTTAFQNFAVNGDSTLGNASTDATTINGIANVQNLRGKVQTVTATGVQTITLSADTTILELAPTAASQEIIGITGGAAGRMLLIHNSGTQNSLFYDQNAGATAADRIVNGMSGGSGLLVAGAGQGIAWYDSTSARWRMSWFLQKTAPQALTALGDISTSGSTIAGFRSQGGSQRVPTFASTNLTTGTVNNWNPDGSGSFDSYAAGVIDVTTATGANTITGIDATNAADGDELTIFNRSGQSLAFTNQDTGSSAANRLTLYAGSTQTIPSSGGAIKFIYKNATVGWFQIAIASATVTPATTFGSTVAINGNATTNANTTLGDASSDTLTITAKIDSKIYRTGSAPSLSACGTSPTITGNDAIGSVTGGTGSPTGCVITFAAAYSTNAPVCVITPLADPGTANIYISAVSTSALTVAFSAASNSFPFAYHCEGRL